MVQSQPGKGENTRSAEGIISVCSNNEELLRSGFRFIAKPIKKAPEGAVFR